MHSSQILDRKVQIQILHLVLISQHGHWCTGEYFTTLQQRLSFFTEEMFGKVVTKSPHFLICGKKCYNLDILTK